MNPEASRAPRQGRAVLLLLAGGYVAWALAYIWRGSFVAIDGVRYFDFFDDALVSMRYAWNLTHGLGLVWNAGQRVEGYTNLLMTLFMSIWTLFLGKREAVLAVKLAGIPFVLAAAYLAARVATAFGLAPDPTGARRLAVLTFAGTLLYYPLSYWALMGMETGMETVLLLVALLLLRRLERSGRPADALALGSMLGLLYLTRADTLILAVLLLAYLLWVRRGLPRRQALQAVWPAAAVLAAFVVAHAAFEILYYGAFLPNTYALKLGGYPLGLRLKNGFSFLIPFFGQLALAGALVTLGLLLDVSKEKVLLALVFLSLLAYQVWVGGDAWRLWRFLVPAVPLLLGLAIAEGIALSSAAAEFVRSEPFRRLVLRAPAWNALPGLGHLPRLSPTAAIAAAGLFSIAFGAGVDAIGLSGPGFGEEQRAALVLGAALLAIAAGRALTRPVESGSGLAQGGAAFVLTLLCISTLDGGFFRELTLVTPPQYWDFDQANVNRSVALLDLTRPEASVGVFGAGGVPYYTGRPAVDFLGKSDAHIAALPPDLSGSVSIGRMVYWPGHAKYDLEYSIGTLHPTYVQSFVWGNQDLRAEFQDVYERVSYQGIELYLLRGSPDVHWERVAAAP